MRIALIDPAAFTLFYDHALAQALGEQGIQVNLLTSHYPADAFPTSRDYGVRLFFRSHAGNDEQRTLLGQAQRLARHTRDMRRLKAEAADLDLMHFQWCSIPLADMLVRLPKLPLVLTAHDIRRRETAWPQQQAQLHLYRRADAVITHYRRGRERLLDAGVAPEKISVIPMGAYQYLASRSDEVPLSEELSAWDGPVVLFFGVLRPNKGLDVLLDAWRGVDDAQLWIVGTPHMDIASLRARAQANVRFVTRWVSDQELPAFFRRADLVVLPYTDIDQSGVALTAVAFGKALLLTDVGGFSDIAAEGAARIVAPNDPAALHAGLVEILGDQRKCEQLAARARSLADGAWSWSNAAAQTVALYRRVLSGC